MMRMIKWGFVLLLGVMSTSALAGIYMGTTTTVTTDVNTSNDGVMPMPMVAPYTNTYPPINLPCQPYSGKGPMAPHACAPVGQVNLVAPEPISVDVQEGSLKANVERIVSKAGWGKPIWKMEYDFKWTGDVTITGRDIQSILSKLLDPYPLQAKFYESNHIVAIYPRRNT